MSAQRPGFKAYEPDPAQVKVWLKETWPEVQQEAKRRRARVYFGDESTIRSDYHRGTTWGVRGDTLVVAKTGRRFSVNRLSAVSPKGHLRFMVTESRVTADVFIDFLRRLLHNAKRAIYWVVDGHRIHRAKKVQEFVRTSQGRLTLVLLVLPGLVWVKLQSPTKEHDCCLQVLGIPMATSVPSDGLDLAVHPLGHSVGHTMSEIVENPFEMILDRQRNRLDRLQLAASRPTEPALEELAPRFDAGSLPEFAQHFFNGPRATGLQVHSLQAFKRFLPFFREVLLGIKPQILRAFEESDPFCLQSSIFLAPHLVDCLIDGLRNVESIKHNLVFRQRNRLHGRQVERLPHVHRDGFDRTELRRRQPLVILHKTRFGPLLGDMDDGRMVEIVDEGEIVVALLVRLLVDPDSLWELRRLCVLVPERRRVA
ncbi:MAG: hypothetical protein GKR94_02560 [Gammaproteobacteria bacterium]|nr:hypothetical protein [Gammaproteobacteria bacterium]